jgi:hypothetical protein
LVCFKALVLDVLTVTSILVDAGWRQVSWMWRSEAGRPGTITTEVYGNFRMRVEEERGFVLP